jgi:hypothetical protein
MRFVAWICIAFSSISAEAGWLNSCLVGMALRGVKRINADIERHALNERGRFIRNAPRVGISENQPIFDRLPYLPPEKADPVFVELFWRAIEKMNWTPIDVLTTFGNGHGGIINIIVKEVVEETRSRDLVTGWSKEQVNEIVENRMFLSLWVYDLINPELALLLHVAHLLGHYPSKLDLQDRDDGDRAAFVEQNLDVVLEEEWRGCESEITAANRLMRGGVKNVAESMSLDCRLVWRQRQRWLTPAAKHAAEIEALRLESDGALVSESRTKLGDLWDQVHGHR